MATGPGVSTPPTLSPLAKYVFLVIAVFASLIGAYALKLYPTEFGNAGAATSILGFFAFLSADLESTPEPRPIPRGTTFVVVTIGAAVYAGLGVFTSNTLFEYGAFLSWFLFVAEYLLTTFRENLEEYVPSAYDSAIVVAIGLFVAFVQYLSAHPTESLISAIAAFAVTIPSYINQTGPSPSLPEGSVARLRDIVT